MEDSGDFIVITVNGPDAQGIVSSFTSILSENEVRIVDIEQIVIHNLILLSMLLDLRQSKGGQISLLKDLLLEAKRLNVDLDFKVASREDQLQYDNNFLYAITCLGDKITADVLARISRAMYSENVNIERITQLSQGELSCVEMIVNTDKSINVRDITRKLLSISSEFGVDIAVQKENIFRRSKRLVVMDMDSTLIQVEVIDELAKAVGRGDEVSAITRRAMNGEIGFNESLDKRVGLLAGLDEEALDKIYNNIPFTPGAKKFIKILKKILEKYHWQFKLKKHLEKPLPMQLLNINVQVCLSPFGTKAKSFRSLLIRLKCMKSRLNTKSYRKAANKHAMAT